MTLVWITVALVFAIVEVASVALFAGFVALGALGAAVAAFVGGDVPVQVIVFALVSILGIAAVRAPLVGYLRARHVPGMASGAAGMIGQTALVVDPIGGPHHRGHVRIAGEDWPALAWDGQPVAAGTPVRVVDIHRATLVVEPASDDTGGLGRGNS